MALPLDQFVQHLEESGILTGETIRDFIPPKAYPTDAEELALELVRRKKLTKYQAAEVIKGNGKSLTLGTYVLLEKIGAGGMGQVFKARHRRMDRIVALKVLPAEMAKNAAAIARFQREVIASARLRHPNIVSAEDADCADGVNFLVMELVEGKDLSALVKKNGPFPVEHAVNFVLQAARGLQAAHAEGIVHRDIKPHNLLLDGSGTIKILDLGLARLSGDMDGPSLAELTSTGAIMGTVDYMAPEQAIDTKSADARADIYALGCTLHYLLVGKALYEGDSLMKKLLAHREQTIPSLRDRRAEVPERIDAIFQRMVAKKVTGRFQTMTEVLAALESDGPLPPLPLDPAHPLDSSGEVAIPDFFKDLSSASAKSVEKKKTSTALRRKKSNWMVPAAVGGVGLMLLVAALAMFLPGREGSLEIALSEPDALVQVRNAAGKVVFARKRAKDSLKVSLPSGVHHLKVVKDGFQDFEQEVTIVSGKPVSISAQLEPLDDSAAASWEKFGASTGTSGLLAYQLPGFEDWLNNTVPLPPREQVNRVRKKLRELNPRFDGKFTHKVTFGAVSEVQIQTDEILDLSPLRAFPDLIKLQCDASGWTKVGLSDLSALRGLKLMSFSCLSARVTDLAPLKGMPLTNLNCANTDITDLSPLKGMKLEALSIRATAVDSLEPLRGMPLSKLDCLDTKVHDLTPLQGMPLTQLVMSGTPVIRLEPLKGMPLEHLEANGLQAADLSPLRGMPLTSLEILGAANVTDTSPLEDLPLKILRIDFDPQRDTKVLRSIKTLESIADKPAADFWKEAGAEKS